MEIQHIFAQELLDSRGYPTVEVTVCMDLCRRPSGMAPSGTSKGKYEAVELRDDDPDRYLGKGVRQAVRNVNEIIAPALIGLDPTDQWALDQRMIELDGTSNKSHLGANAILAVSIACLRAGACAEEIPLFQRVAELRGRPRDGPFTIPVPLVNLLNGGRHASDSADFQEYMVVPVGAPTIVEAIRWSAEVFHRLKTVIKRKGGPSAVGDEGGFAPPVRSNEEPLRLLVAAIQEAGYLPGEEIALALDVAASELYRNGRYHLKQEGLELTTEELVDLLVEWTERYPIVSIEDGLDQEDWDGFALLQRKTENRIQIVGDDLFVTNPSRLRMGIEHDAANSVLIKANQIGTITETLETIDVAEANDRTAIISHRSGETELAFEADFAVGTGVGQIKSGSLSRSERIAEYNQLMRIERQLGTRARFASFPFARCADVRP
jgi:enolase